MKRTLLQITLDEESGEIETILDCTSDMEVFNVCKNLSDLCEKNHFFSKSLCDARLVSLMEHIAKDISDVKVDSAFPDFNEVLRKAKVDPNNHIKEN